MVNIYSVTREDMKIHDQLNLLKVIDKKEDRLR